VPAVEGIRAIADSLIEALDRSRDVLELGEPEDRKRLVRAFLRGIEIRKSARQAILWWYRVPAPENLSVKLVAPRGIGLNRLRAVNDVDEEALPLPPPRSRCRC
jgi:hypothetical protein